MPVIDERLTELDALILKHGSHEAAAREYCVMERPNGCIEWSGRRDENGYGWARGNRRAHRVAWEQANGRSVPVGMIIMHSCDNPPCVNPAHLSLGTTGENNRDRHRKGRSRGLFESGPDHPATLRSGERHWRAKLTNADVEAMRARRNAGESTTALAKSFGVNSGTVSRITRGIWR